MSIDQAAALKALAAEKAVESLVSGMVVGLGTGTTAKLAIDAIARRQREEGLRIAGIPTSETSRRQAEQLGIPLTDFASIKGIDLTIDGADAVEPDDLCLIKGKGGALLREKIVAAASRRMLVIVDESKLRAPFGDGTLVPVEVVQFGWQSAHRKIAAFGCRSALRETAPGLPFMTDNGNLILDCDFGAIGDPAWLEAALNAIPGVVDSGLFIGLATEVIIAGADGIKILTRPDAA